MELANQQALLAEELTETEVRDLLERLNAREFGGSENATVGAVVEATGADVTVVGRLLAEIRKEDFEEKFGLQLKDHGRRIETLEERSHRLEIEQRAARPKSYLRNEPETDEYRERALDRLAEQERRNEEIGPTANIVGIIFILLLVIYGGVLCAREQAKIPHVPPKPLYQLQKMDGTVIYDNPEGAGILVKESSGKIRPATEVEESEWAAMAMAHQRK